MRHFILVFVATIIYSFAGGQSRAAIRVVLKNVPGNEPFYSTQTRTHLSDSVGFRGIPSDLQAYRIKALQLSTTGESLFLLYGITSENKRLVLFDTNFDKDFRGEEPYSFVAFSSYDRAQEKTFLDTVSSVEVRLPNAPAIYIKPNPFNCCFHYNDSLEAQWHLFVQSAHHREGSFAVNGEAFKMAMAGSYSPFFRAQRTTFFVLPDGQQFEKQSNSNQPYVLKSPVSVKGHEFVVDSLSRFGDTAWVLDNGYKKKAQGNRVGLYAENIKTKTVAGQPFNLEKLRGKYVLLDFWGTWCNPCIALLPELRRLHQEYTGKGFALVSVAYDTKKSYAKLLNAIKKYQMEWTNLFDDQKGKKSIADQYEVQCFPTSVLINPQGQIIFRSCGEEDFQQLKTRLAEAIK